MRMQNYARKKVAFPIKFCFRICGNVRKCHISGTIMVLDILYIGHSFVAAIGYYAVSFITLMTF